MCVLMEYISQNSDFTFHDSHLLRDYLIFYGKQLCLKLAVRIRRLWNISTLPKWFIKNFKRF